MSKILAIDLGGSRLRAGIADSVSPTKVTGFGDWAAPTDIGGFKDMVGRLLAEHGADRLGVAIPGLARGTTAEWVPNLPYLDGAEFAELFPGTEIGLGHDAQLALLAEVTAGAAQGMSDAILLAIGTGIGSAVLAGGRILRGATGAACSFGWAVADVDDPGEDRLGWLERHASGRALDAAAATIGLRSGAALMNAARLGSDAALSALEPAMRALGTTLAGAVALLDPEAIILAGGVASSADVIAPLVLAQIRRHLPPHLRGITIKPGQFGPRAGLVGAAVAGAHGRDWGNGHG